MNCTAQQASEDWLAKHPEDTEGPTGERRSTVDATPDEALDGSAACSVSLKKQVSDSFLTFVVHVR
jgi:hypothetical protein